MKKARLWFLQASNYVGMALLTYLVVSGTDSKVITFVGFIFVLTGLTQIAYLIDSNKK